MLTDRRSKSTSILAYQTIFIAAVLAALAVAAPGRAQQQPQPASSSNAIYRQSNAPIEARIDDLLGRMTLEERARQLDLYSGSKSGLVDKFRDGTHAAVDAIFLPGKAEALWGSLGVGGIHDL